MPDPALPHPRAILCATDLSSRCDRALDRAAMLAREWHAQLVVVHALETTSDFLESRRLHDLPSWRRPEDRAAAVARLLHADMVDLGSDPLVVVEPGEPAPVILAEAQRRQADLIVTGVARSELFGRRLLGATVDQLIRRADAPILLVRGRPRQPYRNIVVASDFSPGSRDGLELALRLFASASLTLFHAYKVLTGGGLDSGRTGESWRSLVRHDAETFLDRSDLGPRERNEMRLLLEEGDPELLLRDYVDAAGVDLVVTGAPSRGAMMEMLLGSTAQRLVDGLPCDVLVARPPIETPA